MKPRGLLHFDGYLLLQLSFAALSIDRGGSVPAGVSVPMVRAYLGCASKLSRITTGVISCDPLKSHVIKNAGCRGVHGVVHHPLLLRVNIN